MTRRLARVSPFIALALAASLGFSRAALSTPQDAFALSRLAAPSGYADIVVVSQSGTLPAVGSTLVIDVRVEPNNVQVDAAAAYLTYNAEYLDLVDLVAGSTDDTLIHRDTDTPGAVYYAAGRLSTPWPTSSFSLARLTFRLKAAPPASLSLNLEKRTDSNPNLSDVASAGSSVLAAALPGTITFATPTAVPSATSTVAPTRTATPVPTSTPVRTSTPVPASNPPSRVAEPITPPPPPAAPSTNSVSTGSTTSGSSNVNSPVSGGTGANSAPALGPANAPAAAPLAGNRGRPNVSELLAGNVPPLPETVQVGRDPVGNPFEQFYTERQGIRILGNTLASLTSEAGVAVQYFEKGRIEEHPSEANPAWRFQYGLLVDELAAAQSALPVGGDASTLTYNSIHLLSQPPMRVAAPEGFVGGTATLPDGSVFIPFSAELQPGPGQVVPTLFWNFINNEAIFPGGWLHDVGLPITAPVEAVVDKGPNKGRRILVQAFQRTILTYDPLNPADFQVERANVGTDYARAFPEKFAP